MTTNHWRANNAPRGLPALVHMPTHVHADLAHSIRAGNKGRRADAGRSSKGGTYILHIDLSADAAEGVRAQDVRLAGFTRREDEVVGQQHRPLRSQILVVRVFS